VVVVEDGRITSIRTAGDIGPDTGPETGPDPDPGAEELDLSDQIVMPGLVDTHRHTWQSAIRHLSCSWTLGDYFANVFFRLAPLYRPEDAWAGSLLGALGAIDGGVTTLVDWSHIQSSPEHSDACIDALQQAGLRAVFAYGWPQDDPARWVGGSDTDLPADIRRVRSILADDRARVTMAMAARGPELASFEVTARDIALARELDLAVTMHVGAGELGPHHRAVERLAQANLLDARTTLVHACTCSDRELGLAAAAGATASVSPMIEATMDGLGTTATARLRAAGVRAGISTDSEIATSGDLFSQLRAALVQDRVARRSDPAYPSGAVLQACDLLRMATIDGAIVAGVGDRAGSLTPGKRADLIGITMSSPGLGPVREPADAVVLGAHPGHVRTVIADGLILKRDGELTGPVSSAMRAAETSVAHLLGG
jgi:cytosine/adenosine deaminase-related metal-dependent hydrolase